MNNLVKIIKDEDGLLVEFPKWHIINPYGDAHRVLCSGEVFGEGEGRAIYKTKKAERGITCSDCINFLKYFKKCKL